MAYFPGTQSFRQGFPRTRTKQGGDNRRAVTANGLPNLMARGLPVPGRGAGNRLTPPPGWSQGKAWWKQDLMKAAPPTPPTPTTEPVAPPNRRQAMEGGLGSDIAQRWLSAFAAGNQRQNRRRALREYGQSPDRGIAGPTHNEFGYDPYSRASIAENRARLEAQAAAKGEQWAPPFAQGMLGRANQDVLLGAGTAGPTGTAPVSSVPSPTASAPTAPGPAGPQSGAGTPPMADEYQQALARMGLPLDPVYEMLSNQARSQRDIGLMNVNTAYDTQKAQAELQNVLAQRGIDENAAARGLFGSGIEARNERVQNTEHTQGLLGLLQQKLLGTQGAYSGYANAMQQAILDLAQRQMQDPYSAVPNYYDWQTGESTIANNQQGGGTAANNQQGGTADRIARLRGLIQGGTLTQAQRSRIRDRIQGLR